MPGPWHCGCNQAPTFENSSSIASIATPFVIALAQYLTLALKMQLAEILSDLTSLQVCDPAAALALVSARAGPEKAEQNSLSAVTTQDDDADLKRAKDLLELHAAVKVAHQDGTDHELNQAREDVQRILQSLR